MKRVTIARQYIVIPGSTTSSAASGDLTDCPYRHCGHSAKTSTVFSPAEAGFRRIASNVVRLSTRASMLVLLALSPGHCPRRVDFKAFYTAPGFENPTPAHSHKSQDPVLIVVSRSALAHSACLERDYAGWLSFVYQRRVVWVRSLGASSMECIVLKMN